MAVRTMLVSIFNSPGTLKKTKIRYIRYKCKYDPPAHTYSSLQFAGFYNENKERVMENAEETLAEGMTYKGDTTTYGVIQGSGQSILQIPAQGYTTSIADSGDVITLLKGLRQ